MKEIGEAARSIRMTLRQLIEGLAGAKLTGDASVEIRGVHDDSRKVGPGDVFVAVKGLRSDGHDFVAKAVAQGAAAVVVEHEVDAKVPQVIVASTAKALGVLVGRALGDPAAAMKQAFASVSPDQLDQDMRQWLVNGKHSVLHFKVQLQQPAIAVRELHDADVYAIRAFMRYEFLGDREHAKQELATAEAMQPDHPIVRALKTAVCGPACRP